MESIVDNTKYRAAGKLKGKVAIITGADSGIGRAVAIAFAKEGANVTIAFHSETEDAKDAASDVHDYGSEAITVMGDLKDETTAQKIVDATIKQFGKIDIVVNNAGTQHVQKSLEDIDKTQLLDTFGSNIFSMFYLTRAALPHLKEGSCIINTTSVTAYRGSPELVDYSSTKGAITSFTRSLSLQLAKQKIRVNAVAPGPVWTPLITNTFSKDKQAKFGTEQPLGRAGQPFELAPAYVFLASDDASYITGQVLHVNGGEVINT